MCALNDIIECVSVGSYLRIDAFANNDRVVNDDAKNNNKAKQTDGIDRHRPGGHEPERAQK